MTMTTLRSTMLVLGLCLFAGRAFAAWPEFSTPIPASGGGERDAALIVGVENYLAVPPVTGAVKNATDWYLYLTNVRKVPTSSITLLRDKEATAEKLRKFAAQTAAQAKAGGSVWFIFIGHGAPAPDGRDGVLVGFDAQQDADSLYARSVPQTELLGLLGGGAQARTIALVDACFSGRAPGGAPLVPGLQPVIPVMKAIGGATGKPLTVVTAGTNDQFAGPLSGASRPAFSYLMLGALRGWGDADRNGQVTVSEALAYTLHALQSTVKDRTQTPQLVGPDGLLGPSGREAGPDLAALVVAPPPAASPGVAPVKREGTAPRALDAPSTGLLTIAVPEFKARLPPEMQWLGGSLSDALLGKLGKSRQVRVVEREFLEAILGELKLQSSSLVDPTTAVKAGRLLGARMFVVGSVAQIDGGVVVRARILNVERGELIGDQIEVVGSPTRLLALQNEVAREVVKQLSIQLALADGTGLETNELAFEAAADLERLKGAVRGLPFFGLDPARKRRTAEFQSGLDVARRLRAAYPRLVPALVASAQLSMQLDDFDGAQVALEVARQVAPGEVDPLLAQANLAASRNALDEAWQLYVEGTQRFGDDSRVWYGLGRVQLKRGDSAGAIVSLLGSLERGPRITETESTLFTLLGPASSPELIGQVSALNPRSGAAAAAYRAYWARAPNATVAADALRAVPGLPIGHLLQAQLDAQANPARAEQALRTALSLQPSLADTHRELGLLLASQGRCDDARAHIAWYLKKTNVVLDFEAVQQRLARCRP